MRKEYLHSLWAVLRLVHRRDISVPITQPLNRILYVLYGIWNFSFGIYHLGNTPKDRIP